MCVTRWQNTNLNYKKHKRAENTVDFGDGTESVEWGFE